MAAKADIMGLSGMDRVIGAKVLFSPVEVGSKVLFAVVGLGVGVGLDIKVLLEAAGFDVKVLLDVGDILVAEEAVLVIGVVLLVGSAEVS